MRKQKYKSINEFLERSERGKRVFIGGDYDFLPMLRKIQDYVEELNFHPILAIDIENISFYEIYQEDLHLLKMCDYALFEVTHPAGQLMELERARDFLSKNLRRIGILFQVRYEEDKSILNILYKERCPGQVTSMAISFAPSLTLGKVYLSGYLTFEDLRSHINCLLI